jgi:hypothetical protein
MRSNAFGVKAATEPLELEGTIMMMIKCGVPLD